MKKPITDITKRQISTGLQVFIVVKFRLPVSATKNIQIQKRHIVSQEAVFS